MIYVSIVDDEEAVVAFRIGTYFNGRVLAIVLFKVETQVVAYLIRIDEGTHAIAPRSTDSGYLPDSPQTK